MITNIQSHVKTRFKLAAGNEYFLNFLCNIFLQFSNAVSGLILPPFIIKVYGSDVNGLVSTLKQIVTYIGVVEAGVGIAAITALFKLLNDRDIQSQNRLLSSVAFFYRKIAFFYLLILISVICFFELIKSPHQSASALLLVMGGANVIDFYFIAKYKVLLIADKRNSIVSLIQSITVIVSLVISFFLIQENFDIQYVFVSVILSSVVRYILVLFYTKKNYPENVFGQSDSWPITQRWSVLIHQVSALIVFNTPIVLVAIFCGFRDASIYSIYSFIFSSISMLLSTLSNGLYAFLGRDIVMEEKAVFSEKFRRFEVLYYFSTFMSYVVCYLTITSFIKVYTKNSDIEYFDYYLSILFVVVGVLDNLRVPGGVLINASGLFDDTKKRAIIEAFINIIASLFFVHQYGMHGVLLGAICSYLYRVVDINIYVSKTILKRNIFPLVLLLIGLSLSSFVCFGFVRFIVAYTIDDIISWFVFLLYNSMLVFVFFALAYVVFGKAYINSDNRALTGDGGGK